MFKPPYIRDGQKKPSKIVILFWNVFVPILKQNWKNRVLKVTMLKYSYDVAKKPLYFNPLETGIKSGNKKTFLPQA